MATDLRASACLVIAGLVADGRDDDRPHLPSRSRLRAHRGEALGARRAHPPRLMTDLARFAARPRDDLRRRLRRGAAVSRSSGRRCARTSALAAPLPFRGADLWTAYEMSWLDPGGKPQVAIATFAVPAESPRIVESKSVKLYLTAFNQTRFASAAAVAATIERDLGAAAGAPIGVTLLPPEHLADAAAGRARRRVHRRACRCARAATRPRRSCWRRPGRASAQRCARGCSARSAR